MSKRSKDETASNQERGLGDPGGRRPEKRAKTQTWIARDHTRGSGDSEV